MRVARLHRMGDIRLHHETELVPDIGRMLLQSGVIDICGSDLHWFGEEGIGAPNRRPINSTGLHAKLASARSPTVTEAGLAQ